MEELTPEYANPVYINIRNIAASMLFYTLLFEGVKWIVLGLGKEVKLEPLLNLLFSLSDKSLDLFLNWQRYLLDQGYLAKDLLT